MSLPSGYGDVEHPELLSGHPGAEALERYACNIRLVKHYPEQKFDARNSKFETNPNDQRK
jgi:hypothetical protein